MEIIVPIGIPGSGKSRLYKKRYSQYELISTDDINIEITGDINDYSRMTDVHNEVSKRITECVENDRSFYYDNCNVYTESRMNFSNQFKGTGIKIVYVVLPCDVEVCLNRIEEDIKNNVVRANVSRKTIIQHYYFYICSILSKFKDENVQEIIYLKPEDLD